MSIENSAQSSSEISVEQFEKEVRGKAINKVTENVTANVARATSVEGILRTFDFARGEGGWDRYVQSRTFEVSPDAVFLDTNDFGSVEIELNERTKKAVQLYAEALQSGNKDALQALSDEGIPEIMKIKLKELYSSE